jgi:hypothetical protein
MLVLTLASSTVAPSYPIASGFPPWGCTIDRGDFTLVSARYLSAFRDGCVNRGIADVYIQRSVASLDRQHTFMKGMTSPFCRAFRSSWLNTLMDWPRVSRKDIGTPERRCRAWDSVRFDCNRDLQVHDHTELHAGSQGQAAVPVTRAISR